MVENLSCCPSLQTVNLSHNALVTPASISHFVECPSITNIDITNNKLEANEEFLEIFKLIPSVVTLSLNGNGINNTQYIVSADYFILKFLAAILADITKLSSFRKRMISNIPKLGYLDRPIDEQERLFAEAFVAGGAEAETIARSEWKTRQAEKRVSDLKEFKAWQAEQQRLRDVARAEGRSLITALSPEVMAARAAEAQAAADSEREMLDLGIGRLAGRYWQNEDGRTVESASGIMGLRSNRPIDPLEDAAKQLLLEKKKEVEKVSQVISDEDVQVVVEAEPPVPPPSSGEMSHCGADIVEADETESTYSDHEVREEVPVEYSAEWGRHGETAKEDVTVAQKEEEEPQEVRDRRIAESLAIYRRQLEEQRQRGGAALNTYSHSSTWSGTSTNIASTSSPAQSSRDGGPHSATPSTSSSSAAPVEGTVTEAKKRPLYWSETMDVELGKLVKACVFDFDRISERMVELAERGLFADGSEPVRRSPKEVLTSDECRLRWSQLDAALWSDASQSSSTSALDTVFKICVNPSVLGAGHG